MSILKDKIFMLILVLALSMFAFIILYSKKDIPQTVKFVRQIQIKNIYNSYNYLDSIPDKIIWEKLEKDSLWNVFSNANEFKNKIYESTVIRTYNPDKQTINAYFSIYQCLADSFFIDAENGFKCTINELDSKDYTIDIYEDPERKNYFYQNLCVRFGNNIIYVKDLTWEGKSSVIQSTLDYVFKELHQIVYLNRKSYIDSSYINMYNGWLFEGYINLKKHGCLYTKVINVGTKENLKFSEEPYIYPGYSDNNKEFYYFFIAPQLKMGGKVDAQIELWYHFEKEDRDTLLYSKTKEILLPG